MPNWTNGYVEANGLRLFYTRTGGVKPPLVLAHGHSDNGLCWTRVAKELEADYDLIMYDARRHGLSDDGPANAERAPEDGAHDCAGVIQAFGLKKPGVMGHSMGAATAARTAALHADLLSYIILDDVPWRDPASQTSRGPRRTQPATGPELTREEWLAQIRTREPNWHEDEVQAWADAKVQYHRRDWTGGRTQRPPWQEVAKKITCPTLLVTGDPEAGAIVTPKLAQEALGLLKQGQLAHIAGAGHSIHRDRFEAFMEAVRGFLAKM